MRSHFLVCGQMENVRFPAPRGVVRPRFQGFHLPRGVIACLSLLSEALMNSIQKRILRDSRLSSPSIYSYCCCYLLATFVFVRSPNE